MKSKLKIGEAERTDLPEVIELWQELMQFQRNIEKLEMVYPYSCQHRVGF